MKAHKELIEKYVDYLLTNSRPEAPVWNIESIRSGKKPGWNYIDGVMIRAVLELYEITGKGRYLQFADEFIDYYVREDGTILGFDRDTYNLDNINEGKVLFDLFEKTGKDKYEKALAQVRSQLDSHPRTEGGNFWHKKIYPYQVWLDGLYMAQPFLIEYETRYHDCAAYNDVFQQFENVVRLMKDTTTGLYYHGYDESRTSSWGNPTTGLSPNFWLRALGWFAMAMVDVLEKVDLTRCQGRDRAMGQNFRALIDALLTYQDPSTGMWYQLVDRSDLEGNYLETSGSAILSYCILKAVRLGILDPAYATAGERAFEGICDTYVFEEGGHLNLGGICLVAGLGGAEKRDGSVEYYLSEPIVNNEAKGVGPLLLAYTEILRR